MIYYNKNLCKKETHWVSYLFNQTFGLNNIKIDPKDMARVEAIVLSMTPQERRHPEIIKASRKTRIAKGCGLSVQEVNKLLTQFEQMKKMMKQMSGGNMKLPPNMKMPF